MGKILIYDDEPAIVEKIKSTVRRIVPLKPIVFTKLASLKNYIYSEENWEDVKGLIFDLAQKKEEDAGITDFEILDDIKWCYENRRVPILIHSAYAEELEVLNQYPTVFLFKKGARSIRNLRDHLTVMENSGFLDLFCEGKFLRNELMVLEPKLRWGDELVKNSLHDHFVSNFKNKDILDQLNDFLKTENPKRNTYEKYFKPAVEYLQNIAEQT